jgi:polar amino acid transport system substrate-binding protein
MKAAVLWFPLLLLAACATSTPPAPDVVRDELAPGGKLRLGVVAPAGAPAKGVGVDIGGELARRLGVPLEVVRYDTPTALWVGVTRGEWDVATLPIDPQRASEMNFTAAYLYQGEALVALAVARGRNASYPWAYEFIEELKSSGFVGESISRAGLPGARVAPARAK